MMVVSNPFLKLEINLIKLDQTSGDILQIRHCILSNIKHIQHCISIFLETERKKEEISRGDSKFYKIIRNTYQNWVV